MLPEEWEHVLGFPVGWTAGTPPGEMELQRIAELRAVLDTSGADVPRGGQDQVQFEYDRVPNVFQVQRGWGPLIAAADTNILVHYWENAETIWAGSDELEPSSWADPAIALRDLITVWMWRDIRFYVSPLQLEDARKKLTAERARIREAVLDGFYADFHERGGSIPAWSPSDAAPFIGSKPDRALVEDALANGCHVFLTEDKRDVLRHREKLCGLGIVPLRPRELLHELLVAEELTFTRCASGLVPDSHSWTHLIAAVRANLPQGT
jgi:hypothetical protein